MTMTPDDREFIDEGKTLLKQEWHGSYEEEQTKMFLGLLLTKYEELLAAGVAPVAVDLATALRFCTCSHWLEAHHERKCLEFACACQDFSPVVAVDEAKLTDAIADELETDSRIAEEWSLGKLDATARRLVQFAVVPVLRGGER